MKQEIVDLGVTQKVILAFQPDRRKRLAALPIHDKVKILVKLQEVTAPLMRARGEDVRVWKLE